MLEPRHLLASERVIASRPANFLIASADYGLSPFLNASLLNRFGFAGQEALGGRLHVTNFRIVFRSHAANRITGQLSILLPEIVDVRNESSLFVKRMTVTSEAADESFIIWGLTGFIRTIQAAQKNLGPAESRKMWEEVRANPGVTRRWQRQPPRD